MQTCQNVNYNKLKTKLIRRHFEFEVLYNFKSVLETLDESSLLLHIPKRLHIL